MPSGLHTAWLAQLARERKLASPPDSIVRGKPFVMTISFAADFSADTFASSLRLSPDAAGAALADFDVSVGAFADGVTPVTLTLGAGATGALPADADRDGLVWAVFDILHAPSGLAAYRICGGEIAISGKVT